MPDLINLDIAGINICVSSQDSIILEDPAPHYQPFCRKVNKATGAIDVKVRLELENMPNTEKLARIFDTEESWILFRDGDDYFLEFKPSEYGREPFWLARIGSDFARVTVYCGKDLIRKSDGKTKVLNPMRYPLDQFLMMYILGQKEGLLVHAAGIDIDGRGFIFPGKSGAGKSALSRQFVARTDIQTLSDDRIAIRKSDGKFRAFGTPWPGDAGVAANKSAELCGIFFISHGDTNKIRMIKPQEALERLLPVTSIPWYDTEIMSRMLLLCEDMVSHVLVYELAFKPGAEVVDVLQEFMQPEKSDTNLKPTSSKTIAT